MEEQGFVSKNDRIEKPDRKTNGQGAALLPVLWYGIGQTAANKAFRTLTCSSLYRRSMAAIQPSARFPHD
jgi:hypothetical protein